MAMALQDHMMEAASIHTRFFIVSAPDYYQDAR
jgi:hypothetical protein